jgi:flavodoxin
MCTLILYDSVFGNTQLVAKAIAGSLEPSTKVYVGSVSEVDLEKLEFTSLLIVGSPTRGFRPTKPVSEFIEALPSNSLKGVSIATFDTRIDLSTIKSSVARFLVKTGGYAAKPIQKVLEKKGGFAIDAPQGFLVTGEEGPLKEGELERAGEWAKQLLKISREQKITGYSS